MDLSAACGAGLRGGLVPSRLVVAEAAALAGFADAEEYRDYLAGRCTCVTMLAGSGSRWVASLAEAAAAGSPIRFDPAAPRGLYPVKNVTGRGPDPIPIAAYALAATEGLGPRVLVVRGWEDEIRRCLLEPLGCAPGSWSFATQAAPGGKPRGHGDAAFQTMELWRGREYLLVNFGGDASSPRTAFAALAAMDALSRLAASPDGAPGLVLPVAWADSPAYPIETGEDGLPRRFGHAKLLAAGTGHGGQAFTNVGVRVYRSDALARAIASIRAEYWTEDRGYAIPGNDPAGGEFALDNADALMAGQGSARLLHVALPQELSPVKSVSDIERFERDIARVYRSPAD